MTPSIAGWRRDLSRTIAFGRGLCGYSAIVRPRSRTLSKRSGTREIGEAATLMYALLLGTVTQIYCAKCAAAKAFIDEGIALAEEKNALYWRALGLMERGSILALNGQAVDAVHDIASGLAAWRSTGATFWVPSCLSYLAWAHAQLSQFEDAWRCLGEATALAETSGKMVRFGNPQNCR
jgi:hypothetical protein